MRRLVAWGLVVLLALAGPGVAGASVWDALWGLFPAEETAGTAARLDAEGVYDGRDEVALYIHLYGELPGNYMTKAEARRLGWEGGGLEAVAPGMCIGGDRFGNYEGALPEKKGRVYRECDIGTLGKRSRGAKRIVYSNDGLVYYTGDHYESFELLYDGEGAR